MTDVGTAAATAPAPGAAPAPRAAPAADSGGDPGPARGSTMVEALNAALDAEMAGDDHVMVLGEDVGATGGVFRVTAGLQARYGTDRVVDMPIAEAAIVGSAVGLCLAGFRPVVEIQFDAFVYPAFEQIVDHVGRYRWRTAGAASLPMVIRIPYGGGTRAPELHSDSPEALFCHVPGLRVVSPATPADAYSMLRWAIGCPDPVVFLEPKRVYRTNREELPPDVGPGAGRPTAAPGARVARVGDDVSVVTYGSMVDICLGAAEALQAEGVSAEVVDLRSLYPLDEEAVLASVRRTHRLTVVHEAPRSGGLGAEVAALVAERAMLSLEAPIARVGGFDAPFPLFSQEHEYLPSVERVAAAARRTAQF